MTQLNSQLEAAPVDGGAERGGVAPGEEGVGEAGHLPQGRVGAAGPATGHILFEYTDRCRIAVDNRVSQMLLSPCWVLIANQSKVCLLLPMASGRFLFFFLLYLLVLSSLRWSNPVFVQFFVVIFERIYLFLFHLFGEATGNRYPRLYYHPPCRTSLAIMPIKCVYWRELTLRDSSAACVHVSTKVIPTFS